MPPSKDSLIVLRSKPNGLDRFIKNHETKADKKSVARYIDASAKPLDSRKASQSKSDAARFSDCK